MAGNLYAPQNKPSDVATYLPQTWRKPMSDIEIARSANSLPIGEIANKLDIPDAALMTYGKTKAKIDPDYIDSLKQKPDGKLILVTAITPTPAGEGKTTTSVGTNRRSQSHWQGRIGLPAGTQPWALLWYERRRCRWRLCSGCAHGGY
jgi:hypothetical protein